MLQASDPHEQESSFTRPSAEFWFVFFLVFAEVGHADTAVMLQFPCCGLGGSLWRGPRLSLFAVYVCATVSRDPFKAS